MLRCHVMNEPEKLPTGYAARAATLEDLVGVLELIVECDTADYGESDETEVSLRDHWHDLTLATDAVVVLDGGRRIDGYGDLSSRNPVRLDATVYVHPEQTARGIGTWLTRWANARAIERVPEAPEGARVSLGFGVAAVNEAGNQLLTDYGCEATRHFLRMMIEFDSPPAPPVWPDGVKFRPFILGQDDFAAYKALDEAFQDHWGHVTVPFEETMRRALAQESFDPTLWFLAADGSDVAGASICSLRGEFGWINTLGVRRPWRRRGVALALLQHSFAELYRRGRRNLGLYVDASSLTGATRLYERAGMREVRRYVIYSRELRDGHEIATETLED
jgi:GNAT superfamily N-acetyltransferase